MIVLNDFRRKGYSQNAEDGITDKIFELIGTTNKYAVEIGVGNGNECCSRFLHTDRGFNGVMFDCEHEDHGKKVFKNYITVDNVLGILNQHNVPLAPDFLGVDIDSFDFYVLHKVLTKYRPRLIVVETNPTFLLDDKVIKLNHPHYNCWAYHGASLRAWFNSLNPIGYRLVCHEWNGINAFFVRDGLMNPDTILNFNSMKLFSPHDKPGCDLRNYAPYPASFPILTSNEALALLDIVGGPSPPHEIVIPKSDVVSDDIPFKTEFLELVEKGAPLLKFKKFGIRSKTQFEEVYRRIKK